MANEVHRELLRLRVELAVTQGVLARVAQRSGVADGMGTRYFEELEKDFVVDYMVGSVGGGDLPGVEDVHDFAVDSIRRLKVLFSDEFNR